jgi:alpha/beta superfamily hydrolase
MKRLKKLSSEKKRKLGLVFSLSILVFGLVPHIILTIKSGSNHSYIIEPLSLESSDGIYISAWKYTPTGEKKNGGIVVGHYFSGSKLHMHPLSSELAKRGFTVINIDFRGHGASGGTLGRGFENDMNAAINYLKYNVSYITEIGLVGHSYGGKIASKLASSRASEINATVTIGRVPYDVTNISNLLVAVGTFEPALADDDLIKFLKLYTNRENVTIGERYGDFSSGNNTKVYVASFSEHIFEVWDSSIIYHTVQWFEQAFNLAFADNVFVTAPVFQFFSILTLAGIIMFTFVIVTYLSNYLFKHKVGYPEKTILEELGDISFTKFMNYYMIYAVLIGLIIFLFLLELSAGSLPLSSAGLILILTIVNAIGTIFIYGFFIMRKSNGLKLKDIGKKIKKMSMYNSKQSIIFGIFCALLVILSISSIWHWSVMNVLLSIQEIGIMASIFFISFPFFLIKEFYFRTVQGRLKTSSWFREYFYMVFIGIFMDSFLFGMGKLINWVDLIYMPNTFLYLFVWIIFSIIHQFNTTWIYMFSGRNILGSTVFSSMFFAWMSIIFLPSLGFL